MSDEEKFKQLAEGQIIEITKEQLLTELKKAREGGIKEGKRQEAGNQFKQVIDGKIKLEIVDINDPYWDNAKKAMKPILGLLTQPIKEGDTKK